MKKPVGMTAALLAASVFASGQSRPASGLVAHEWGTFTSIAGEDGRAVPWLPQAGPTDLPRFVNRIDCNLKGSLTGTIRMETPVIYFYAPRNITVRASVRFPQGVITEWFPRPAGTAQDIVNHAFRGDIAWTDVKVQPGAAADFPNDGNKNHYYVARNTGAAPLEVGGQAERFLFYRGVGRAQPPITARVMSNGQVVVSHTREEALGDIILFENRDGATGYAVQHTSSPRAAFNAVEPEAEGLAPQLQLEKVLVAHGLYAKEAKAMVESWRGSWFEQGTRLFYILSGEAVDAILPLRIDPQPAEVKRVFVGRIELPTPATLHEVKAALLNGNRMRLAQYGRFLDPIGRQLLRTASDAERVLVRRGLERAKGIYENTTNCGLPAAR